MMYNDDVYLLLHDHLVWLQILLYIVSDALEQSGEGNRNSYNDHGLREPIRELENHYHDLTIY